MSFADPEPLPRSAIEPPAFPGRWRSSFDLRKLAESSSGASSNMPEASVASGGIDAIDYRPCVKAGRIRSPIAYNTAPNSGGRLTFRAILFVLNSPILFEVVAVEQYGS